MLSHIFDMLLSFIVDVVGYLTARVLLPIVSFGVLRIDRLDAEHGPFRWHGFKRMPDGKIVVENHTAGYIGLLFWIAAFVAVVTYWI